MEISYHVSWRRNSGAGGSCSSLTVSNGLLLSGGGGMVCQYGCSGTITTMSYICTDFSIDENWSFGENRLAFNFTDRTEDTIAIGFTGGCWISPLGCSWNISTTFSLNIRNDTGQINSSPRAITTPVLRLQQGCNHTIPLAVSDPDGDIIRCRWAVGRECASVCNVTAFPGAQLDSDTCTIHYEANRGARYWAAAVMIEDFIPGSLQPLSSVAFQFLVLVVASTDPCSQQPELIDPTPPQGSCVAVPPGTTFTTQLTATSGSSSASITEIQTVSPIGTRRGELEHNTGTSIYYINITWTPAADQQNETHSFCYIAVNSEGLASEQSCIQLLVGYHPPALLPDTATPNQQLVHSSNTTWYIEFDRNIQRPVIPSYIIFYEFTSELEGDQHCT
ncbi:integrin beta-like protein C [Dysidea avara]|uniref:integrin beta-like protein C n=1 Tax=Dysidea avara TaxID=196820 RepID=UPI003320F8F6